VPDRKPGRWILDRSEVSESRWGHSSGRRARASQSRALDLTSSEIRLKHLPTGVEVAGEVPQGNRSRVEMQRLQAALRERLYAELEAQVARVLRIPGR
jgi:protein subunit release factor A